MENEDIDIWWKRLWAGFLLLGKRARPTEPQIWMLLGHAVVGEGRQVAKKYSTQRQVQIWKYLAQRHVLIIWFEDI